jgi:hypothetical protein
MRMVRSLVVVLPVLLGALWAAPVAQASVISVGDTVTFADGPGNTGGGAFYLTINGNAGEQFISFCLQSTRPADYTSTFVVTGVSAYAVVEAVETGGDGSGRDYLSSQTAWLYSQLRESALIGYDNSQNAANAFQWAVWVLEGESWEVPLNIWSAPYYALANQYIALANEAVANGFSGLGDVRVLNLETLDGKDAQDQLTLTRWTVPEPSSLALLGSGVFALCVRRRRSDTNAL